MGYWINGFMGYWDNGFIGFVRFLVIVSLQYGYSIGYRLVTVLVTGWLQCWLQVGYSVGYRVVTVLVTGWLQGGLMG